MKWVLACLLLLVVPSVIGASIDVRTYETGKITSYLNTYWVVNVNGTGTISNPLDTDLFEVVLFFDVLGLDVLDRGGDGVFERGALRFDRIPSNGTASFSYSVIGIIPQPPTVSGQGVLLSAFSRREPKIYGDVFGELQKASLEDQSITGRPGRLVSVTLANPTSLSFTVESVRVIKTPGLNPNVVLDEWNIINASNPRLLGPDGFFVHDILDKDSAEGQVYWLTSEVYISSVQLIDNNSLQRYTEENLTIPIELLNYSNETSNTTLRTISNDYLLTKSLSDSLAVPGVPLVVTLRLNNFGPSLENFLITDTLPAGFRSSDNLRWEGQVSGRGTVVKEYLVTLNDTSSAGIDSFPSAQAEIGGKTIYSNEVGFVRQFVPDDKVFVQKRVSYRTDDMVVVEISVQNLGRNTLVGARLKDFLEDGDVFSEITQAPEDKALWKVPNILPGESWEVSYVTEEGESLSTLPMLYGVSSHSVLRTLVLENIINEAWEFVRTNKIEMIGLLLLIGVPVLLIVGRRKHWFG